MIGRLYNSVEVNVRQISVAEPFHTTELFVLGLLTDQSGTVFLLKFLLYRNVKVWMILQKIILCRHQNSLFFVEIFSENIALM